MASRILLIGNGPSALAAEAGDAIDAFDGVVARFNDFKTVGFEKHVGHRTDEWVTWYLFDSHKDEEFARVLCAAVPPAQTWESVAERYPHARRLEPLTLEQTRREMGYDLPSTGAFTVMNYLLEGWHVVLHGFDFFQGPRHHYADDGQIGPRHSPGFELAFFRRLLDEGRVRMLVPAATPGLTNAARPCEADEYKRLAAVRLTRVDEVEQAIERHWKPYAANLAKAREELLARCASLAAERERLVAETKSLASARDELIAWGRGLDIKAASLHERVSRLEWERSKDQERLAAAEALRTALESATASLAATEAAVRRIWNERDSLLAAAEEHRTQLRRLQDAVDAGSAERENLAAQLSESNMKMEALRGRALRQEARIAFRILRRLGMLSPSES